MRVLVVDDEPAARARLRRLLSSETDLVALHEAADAPSALALVQALGQPPELALLDIEMPGASGVQLAAALRELGVRSIVFSTAHAEHALRAFELAAVDYLLKPYTAERLAATLARVREQLARPTPAASLAPAAGQWWVDSAGGRLRIALADVQWLSAADNYVALHLPPHRHYERATLAEALARPAWAGLFVRVHRSHAVNPAHVLRVNPVGSSGDAELDLRCGERLRVSRGFRAVLDRLRG